MTETETAKITTETSAPTAPTNQTLIPRQYAALPKLASTDDSRPFLQGVHVAINPDGSRQLAVTDGHALMVVDIPQDVEPVAEYPPIEGIPVEGSAEGTIPSGAWADAFKGHQLYKRRQPLPILDNMLLAFNGEGSAKLAWTDFERSPVMTVKLCEGRFPNYQQVMPTKEPTASIHLNAHLLKRVLDVFAAMGKGASSYPLRIDFFSAEEPVRISSEEPVRIMATDKSYGTVTALIMPVRVGGK